MKKSLVILLTLLLAISMAAPPLSADPLLGVRTEMSSATILVDNTPIIFDVPPTIIDGIMMVPFRPILQALGATIGWNGMTQTVTATKNNISLSLQINNRIATKNGVPFNLEAPPIMINGCTLVPLYSVGIAMGATVSWDDINNKIIITSNPASAAEVSPATVEVSPVSAIESAPPTTSDGWKTSVPSAQGVDPRIINTIYEDIARNNIKVDGILIVKNGTLVAENYFNNYNRDTLHRIYSVTKSITSTVVGIARDKEKIDLKDKVVDYFPNNDFNNMDAAKASITVRDLLMMAPGIQWVHDPAEKGILEEMWSSPNWVKFVMDRPMETQPGTVFNYNTGTMQVLSAMVTKATGMSAEDYARNNLFTPLGITHYEWRKDPQGNSQGGGGIAMLPRDMAKIGQLMLQNGAWNGQQLISADWVKAATSNQIAVNDIQGSGYGYNWWMRPDLQGYCAAGAFGQLIYVLPNQNMIVVFTGNEDVNTMVNFSTICIHNLQS